MKPFEKLLKRVLRAARREMSSSGFSLVEVLVSGVLVTFSATAVVSVIGTGTRLQTVDNERRLARTLIKTTFEDQYDVRKINTIVPDTTTVENVVIDNRAGVPLTGTLTKKIQNLRFARAEGDTLPVVQITVTCAWMTDPLTQDSVSLYKIIPQPN